MLAIMIRYLKLYIDVLDSHFLNFYLYCSTHIIHLVSQEDLKMLDNFISRIRDVLLHISTSGPKIQSCKQVCK